MVPSGEAGAVRLARGWIWILAFAAVVGTATLAAAQESTVTVSPPSWSPPEWLLGYWSTADGVWEVAAEPGWVDVVFYGDESMVTYTIQDWSDDRGDVFSITVTSAGAIDSIEWETNRRRYSDGGMTWVAQALGENGAPVVEMELRSVNADTVTLLLTVGEDQAGMRLTRDG
jgi:hypothetical protein